MKNWKRGDRVICNGNKEAVVLDHYSGGMYNVRLWSGFRHVGDVCVSGSELTPASVRRIVRVDFDNGDHLTTEINGTPDEIRAYYLNGGPTDYDNTGRTRRPVAVEFLD